MAEQTWGIEDSSSGNDVNPAIPANTRRGKSACSRMMHQVLVNDQQTGAPELYSLRACSNYMHGPYL